MENEIIDIKQFNNVLVTGLTNQLISFSILNIFNNSKRNILFLTNTLYEANKVYNSLSKLNDNTYLFPMDDFITSEALAISPELLSIRLNTLNESLNNKNKIIVTNLMGLLRYLPSKDLWKKNILKIKKGDEISKEKLLEKIMNIGFIPETLVTKTGEVSTRGFILDLFPLNSENPVRIEFWGDEIEKIRYFDAESQRSLEEINEIIITPFSEFINEKNIEIESKQKYLKEVVNEVSSIFNYLDNPITIYKDYEQIKASYLNLKNEIFEYSKTDNLEYKTNYMNEIESIKIKDEIYFNTIDSIVLNKKIEKVYNLNSKSVINFKSNIDLINDYIKTNLSRNKTIIISLKDKSKIKNLKKMIDLTFNENKVKKNELNVIINDYDEGFELDNLILLTEKELFGELKNKGIKTKLKIGSKIKELNNLHVGDYVVHFNHGIGVYNGIKTITKNGNKQDYLEINYYGNDKLYIPVDKIDLINKYSGKEGIAPKINRLSGNEWQKTKIRIRDKIKNIAADLLKISAERKLKKGFKFNEDDKIQKQFESEFSYELTKDQYISLIKIKEKMEEEAPMDMLLCGDVGYGKTEVAFRCIFKAILSNKQVAYLCPTTILSNQQFNNALERFKNYGVRIALINRFTTRKETENILKKLKTGNIDLIFGTHRLLSDDIKFKDLGMLVIDEEQRFGVSHKEKIKQYKSIIDVLTLSATPIPRTLQMSLVGIRDLALIETPPAARYPVQTYVISESKQLIKEAIYKELSRDGQVFILFNNIDQIETKLYEIKSLVPEAKIRIAHGRMSKNEIEDTMQSFINNEFNVLLCTTIIETGIDIPNVNTLIIYNADRFGLSQLYQIRGRVGRSNKIAYAYLMYNKNKVLNEIAVKRLNAIKEFTELGSGFSIAMRDLSIRGAGDILGGMQSGFIDDIGYDLYVKLLNDEVDKLKGIETKREESEENERTLLNISNHISNEYTEDDGLKIEIHKLINTIDSYESIKKVKEEIEDRFGRVKEDLIQYMYASWFERVAKKLEIKEVKETNLYVEIILEKELVDKIDSEKLFFELNKINLRIKLDYKFQKIFIRLPLTSLDKHYVYYLTEIVNKIDEILV